MSVKIVTLRNPKVVAKKFIKLLKKIISSKPNIRIGLIWDESLSSIYELVIKSKKLKWENVKLFSLVEYKDSQSVTFENTLYTEFINKLHNVTRQNYESIKERIDELRLEDRLNDLYKFQDLTDLMIFPIDKRGNFLFNDFESGINYINYGNNGNDIITPGIKSIMFSKQIICFALEDDSEKVVNTINSKIISSNEFVSLLNIHNNVTLFTLYSIIKKKEINKNSYVNDPEGLSDKVLSTTYEGDLTSENLESNDEKISDLTKEQFDDNFISLDDDENEEDSDEDENISNMELSEKEVDIEEEHVIDNSKDDGLAIDEPLNYDRDNLDDVIKNIISDDVEPTQEELNQIELEEESLYDSIKDEYESSINEDQDSLLDSVSESKFDLNFSDHKDKFVEKEETETIIGDKEVESALYNHSEELDDSIINQIREMDKLKDEEIYLQEYQGAIDNEIQELQTIKQQLENELAFMEQNQKSINLDESNTINDFSPEEHKDFNDVYDDELSKIADEYTSKHETLVLYDDEPEKIEIIDESVESPLLYDALDFNDESSLSKDDIENKKLIEDYREKYSYADVEGKTQEEIKKIIKIKEDALKAIELLIKSNKLGIQQTNRELLNMEKTHDDILDKSLHNDYIKVSYVPNERPVPLLMVNNESNQKIYESMVLDMISTFKSNMNARLFSTKNQHYWNMGAYISLNNKTNELELCAFSDISNLVFLLRYLNKNVYWYLSKKNYEIIKEELDKFFGEFNIEL